MTRASAGILLSALALLLLFLVAGNPVLAQATPEDTPASENKNPARRTTANNPPGETSPLPDSSPLPPLYPEEKPGNWKWKVNYRNLTTARERGESATEEELAAILPTGGGDKGWRLANSQRVRLNFSGEPANWFLWEISYDNSLSFSSHGGDSEYRLADQARDRGQPLGVLDPFWSDREENRDFTARGRLHRGYLTFRGNQWKLDLGRRALSWGQGRFLNPLDVISPVDPFMYDLEDIAGSDMIHLEAHWPGELVSQTVWVPRLRYRHSEGETRFHPFEDADFLQRLAGPFPGENWEWMLLGGCHYRGLVAGLEVNGDLKGSGLRLGYLFRRDPEFTLKVPLPFPGATYTKEFPARREHQVVGGASRSFLKGDLRLTAEFFWNIKAPGRGQNTVDLKDQGPLLALAWETYLAAGLTDTAWPRDSSYYAGGNRLLTLNPLFGELAAAYAIYFVTTLDLFAIYDFYGRGMYYGPRLTWAPADTEEFVLGARLFQDFADEFLSDFDEQAGRPEIFFYFRRYF